MGFEILDSRKCVAALTHLRRSSRFIGVFETIAKRTMIIMEQSSATQHYRIVINASAQAIWDAITQPEWTENYGYGGRVEYELKAGGRFSHRASAEMRAMGMPDEMIVGEVIESDPPRKLVQTWHPLFTEVSSAEPYTRLSYTIDVGHSGVCTVTIIHDVTGAPMVAGIVPGGGDPSFGRGGWPWVLSDLKSLLETGKRMPV
jgi:uncharacterized protein YndB with AHSA1/START domain